MKNTLTKEQKTTYKKLLNKHIEQNNNNDKEKLKEAEKARDKAYEKLNKKQELFMKEATLDDLKEYLEHCKNNDNRDFLNDKTRVVYGVLMRLNHEIFGHHNRDFNIHFENVAARYLDFTTTSSPTMVIWDDVIGDANDIETFNSIIDNLNISDLKKYLKLFGATNVYVRFYHRDIAGGTYEVYRGSIPISKIKSGLKDTRQKAADNWSNHVVPLDKSSLGMFGMFPGSGLCGPRKGLM